MEKGAGEISTRALTFLLAAAGAGVGKVPFSLSSRTAMERAAMHLILYQAEERRGGVREKRSSAGVKNKETRLVAGESTSTGWRERIN